jgi:hypothetical protein
VFVSSHILSEVEHACDRVAFLDGIRTMAGGVALTIVWLLVIMSVSGAGFSRVEVR